MLRIKNVKTKIFEIKEDLIFDRLALKRDIKKAKFISHKKVWK
jgi:hypothetical protein